ncbi:hypothetical protein EJB05_30302, partial [Eragrostis curvula]
MAQRGGAPLTCRPPFDCDTKPRGRERDSPWSSRPTPPRARAEAVVCYAVVEDLQTTRWGRRPCGRRRAVKILPQIYHTVAEDYAVLMELLFESATGFDGDYRVTEAYGIHPLPFDGQGPQGLMPNLKQIGLARRDRAFLASHELAIRVGYVHEALCCKTALPAASETDRSPGIVCPTYAHMSSFEGDACNNTEEEEAYHVLKIDGYSSAIDTKGDMLCIVSRVFPAGGHNWQINCYPMGAHGSENMDFIALFVVRRDTDAVDDDAVVAAVTFSLLDRDGKPVPAYSRILGKKNFLKRQGFGYYDFIKRKDLEQPSSKLFIKDDCIAVRVDVRVFKEAPPMMLVPPSDLHCDLGDLLTKGTGTDVEIRVRGEKFVAHRLLLAARSPVFKEQLLITNVVEIEDVEPQVFKSLVEFIYTDACPASDDEFAMAQSLLVAADKYKIQRLKLICEDILLRSYIDTTSVSNLLALAEKHNCPALKEACFDFLGSKEGLFAAIETREYEQLARSCPAMTTELIYNVLNREKANTDGWSQEVQVSVIKA